MRCNDAVESPAAATTSWPAARSAAETTAPTRPAPTTPIRAIRRHPFRSSPEVGTGLLMTSCTNQPTAVARRWERLWRWAASQPRDTARLPAGHGRVAPGPPGKVSPVSTNVAVILAGGVGTRVGLDIPKQLIKIAGRTILEHTLATMNLHPDVDEIVVMMAPGHLDAVRAIVRHRRLPRRSPTSSRAPRPATAPRCARWTRSATSRCKVLFHDAVRPLVSDADHQRLLRGAGQLRRRRRRHPVRRHDHRGRRRQHDSRRSRRGPGCAAGRPRRRSAAR